MKIALPIDAEGRVHERFGRADAWLLIDTETGARARDENLDRDAAHGVGTAASARLIREGVDAVIGPRFGPKAARTFGGAKIPMFLAQPGAEIEPTLEAFASGSLPRPPQ